MSGWSINPRLGQSQRLDRKVAVEDLGQAINESVSEAHAGRMILFAKLLRLSIGSLSVGELLGVTEPGDKDSSSTLFLSSVLEGRGLRRTWWRDLTVRARNGRHYDSSRTRDEMYNVEYEGNWT